MRVLLEARAAGRMSGGINTLVYLPQAESTNAWAKAHLDRFGPVGGVYTLNQTAGRGRLGRAWHNAAGRALYYTAVLRLELADAGALPLYASLAVAAALRRRYGVQCQIKWPNDLLLGGKKVAGILCESCQGPGPGGPRAVLCGVGVNLAQPADYFAKNGLPHATSLALAGAAADPAADAAALAADLTDFAFDRDIYAFEREGFAACRAAYKAACVNLGRRVRYPGGAGVAVDVDEAGRLVVEQDGGGARCVFTGEVSVRGIYGAV